MGRETQVITNGEQVSKWKLGQKESPGTSGGQMENGRPGEMKGQNMDREK